MLILLDHSTPAPLRYALTGNIVVEAFERGWERLVNGDLLNAAEASGFEVMITSDKNIRYQQNLSGRKISLIVLGNAQWPPCAATRPELSPPSTRPHRAATPRSKFRSSEAVPRRLGFDTVV